MLQVLSLNLAWSNGLYTQLLYPDTPVAFQGQALPQPCEFEQRGQVNQKNILDTSTNMGLQSNLMDWAHLILNYHFHNESVQTVLT